VTRDDEHQIVSTLIRYATGIDKRDWQLFHTCFAGGLRADYGDFGVWSSPAAITAAMEKMHNEVGPTAHRLSNFTITPTPDGASARTYVDAILMPKEPDQSAHRAIGFYDDELIKTSDGWKIKHRKFTSLQLT
jgi:3-phenylpropionate/cinnamic acid dioxygenase small subunit